MLEKMLQHRPGGAGVLGGQIGLLDLPRDLRLSEDHRIQSGGDAQQVADRFAAAEVVGVSIDLRRADLAFVGEKAPDRGQALAQALGLGENLHAVAGAEQQALLDAVGRGQPLEHFG